MSGLHLAARLGDIKGDLLDLLLAQPGLEVNIKDEDNMTPLIVACIWGSENSVRKLLQVVGIEINCQDTRGRTALHLALNRGNHGCIQILGEASGLDWNLKNEDGETPLLMAAFYGRADSLEIILSVPQPHVDFTVTDHDGYNVAWCAVLNAVFDNDGDPERCMELLTADPRVEWNSRDSRYTYERNTPLLYCLENGEVGLAKSIIKNPPLDLNLENNAGEFPETIAR